MRPFRRLALIVAVAIGLAPGTLVRTPVTAAPEVNGITLEPVATRAGIASDYPVTGAWVMHAPHPFFGGFSALVNVGGEGLKLGSDRGWMLDLPLADGAPAPARARFFYYVEPLPARREMSDLEAIERDPGTGMVWTAYEGFNTIRRDNPDGTHDFRVPPEMRGWSYNSGPESMVRLADGRFIVLSEIEQVAGEDHPGLLFARDPVEPQTPLAFRFVPPAGFDPVDAAALPDGSVLILLRRVAYTLPAATFDAAIVRADPSAIAADGEWRGEVVARFSGDMFGENFEGIAFVPDAGGGSGAIYLVADDNLSVFQRNLLVRLSWPAAP